MKLKSFIREVSDFPKPGIIFKDITPLLADRKAFSQAITELQKIVEPLKPTHLAGIESRGFIFAAALAAKMKIGFIPVRKPGKLPSKKSKVKYNLEYGSSELEIHIDACKTRDRVVIIDDVLATGGTALAAANLLQKLKVKPLAIVTLIELSFLKGRQNLAKQGLKFFSVINY